MTDWASSGRVKIERAKEHIGQFQAETRAFFKADGYRVAIEKDPQSSQATVRVRGGPIPLRWAAIASDAVHNLRSSLDHLWRQVMYPGGGATVRGEYFPVYASAEKFEASRGREIKGPRKAPVDVLRAVRPYPGGNDALCQLDVIDNRNKHHMLSLTACTLSEAVIESIQPFTIPGDPRPLIAAKLFPLNGRPQCVEDGTILVTVVRAPSVMHMQVQPTFGVAFAEGEILERQPVMPTLLGFAEEVERIAKAFIVAGLLR